MVYLIVPVPRIERPLPMPFETVYVAEGAKARKSDLQLLMLQLTPVSIKMAYSVENL
jgi:hypothetical protein